MGWLLLTAFLLVVTLAVSYYLARKIIYPDVHPLEETYRKEVENGYLDEADFNAWQREEVEIASIYGYTLKGFYFPHCGSQKTVIISHGITWSRFGSVKYASVFRKHGFNVLIYDLRNHGESGGKNTTFGYMEKYDLRAWVDWALDRLGALGRVGTMGESLGAAVSLQHAAVDARVAFTIADCAFSDLAELLKYRLRCDYRLPAFPLLHLANLWCGLLSWMTFDQVSPLREMPHIKTPVMFIHGNDDDYIPPQMSRAMYDAKTSGLRWLYIVPGAKHAKAWAADPAAYEQEVGRFLLAVGLGQAAQVETA